MFYMDIISALHKAGTSSAQIARAHKLAPSTVSNVIHGRSTSKKVAAIIAKHVGKPATEIWPDGRYQERVVQPSVRQAA